MLFGEPSLSLAFGEGAKADEGAKDGRRLDRVPLRDEGDRVRGPQLFRRERVEILSDRQDRQQPLQCADFPCRLRTPPPSLT